MEGIIDKYTAEEYTLYQHNSGLQIVYYPDERPITYAGYAIKVGAKKDPKRYFGMAHLVEHLMFKGTKLRSARSIIRRAEEVGADINAFTSKEETFVYAAFQREYIHRILHLLTDVVQNSQIPEEELRKEKTVIIEEINSYKDSPAEQIFDEFEDLLFSEGDSLGHNILGSTSSVERITSLSARRFMQQNYKPENMVLTLRGKVDLLSVIAFCNHHFPASEERPNILGRQEHFISPKPKRKRVIHRKDTYQTHCLIGGYAYSMHHKDRLILLLLNNILGGPGMNSRLNISLREEAGYVYSVESNYTAFEEKGLFAIYFGSAHKDRERAIELVFRELQRLREEPIANSELLAAKRQFMGQIAISEDGRENSFLAMGKSILFFGKFETHLSIARKIEEIKAEDIQRVARELYVEENLMTLIYC